MSRQDKKQELDKLRQDIERLKRELAHNEHERIKSQLDAAEKAYSSQKKELGSGFSCTRIIVLIFILSTVVACVGIVALNREAIEDALDSNDDFYEDTFTNDTGQCYDEIHSIYYDCSDQCFDGLTGLSYSCSNQCYDAANNVAYPCAYQCYNPTDNVYYQC